MSKRGKKSNAEIAVLKPVAGRRPDPPKELTPEQAEEWKAVVGRMPLDWFPRETHALLVAYCRHITAARTVARLRDGVDPASLAEPDGLARWNRLAIMAERESRAIATLATKMRLAQQSQRTAGSAGTAVRNQGQARPWEYWEGA